MSSFSGKKLVHLDLKGAPPKIQYLLQLIELFAKLGADGILLEYEDMFPYEGELEVLRASSSTSSSSSSHSAYSEEEVMLIQEAAGARGLEVVPLIQTFGHMEFVLKHESLRSLREVDHCLGTLSPHGERPLQLLMRMLQQVVLRHPGLSTLHIGADEVYLLGEGEESRRWLQEAPGRSVEQLFLRHVSAVGRAVRSRWPQITVLMWDDMMRDMSPDTLRDSGLPSLVQPMLWDYSPELDVTKTVSLLQKYVAAGVSELWVAGSFKGSSGVHVCVPSTQRHVDNTLGWIEVAAALGRTRLRGIALTGWQRYDHMSVLCELLPVALPSLASCLQTLSDGQFSAETQSRISSSLGISSVEVEAMDRISEDTVLFPGRFLAEIIVDLNSFLNSEDVRYFEHNMFVRGWFSPHQRQRKMVNPLIVKQIQNQAAEFLSVLQQKCDVLKAQMKLVFPEPTLHEWEQEHVWLVRAPLQRILDETAACL